MQRSAKASSEENLLGECEGEKPALPLMVGGSVIGVVARILLGTGGGRQHVFRPTVPGRRTDNQFNFVTRISAYLPHVKDGTVQP
jgi:hypothetical protein